MQTVKEYDRENLVLKQNFPRDQKDEVLEALTTEVKMVSQNSNLILALGNKNMQPRHWNKVFALLDGAQPSNLRSFTF